jgi:hypothetical protein
MKLRYKVTDIESPFCGEQVEVIHLLYEDELHDKIVFECAPVGSVRTFERHELSIELVDEDTGIAVVLEQQRPDLAAVVRRFLLAHPEEEADEWNASYDAMAKLLGVER